MNRGKNTSIWSVETKHVTMSQTGKGGKQRDKEMVDWSKLPVDLLRLIVLRLFSLVELIRFRSICSSWRSSVSNANNPFRSRPLIRVNPIIVVVISIPEHEHIMGFPDVKFLSRATFFRVSLSSSLHQGRLIKSDVDINTRKLHLLNCLSRFPLEHSCRSLDLLEFTVSEIRQVYEVQDCYKQSALGFKRVVIVKDAGDDHHRILVISWDGKIRDWNYIAEEWRRIPDQTTEFTDIIVHKGLTYALDSQGIVWLISSSRSIYRYGPSLDENITSSCCRDMSFVECCGELYIVERLLVKNDINTNGSYGHRFSLAIHDDVEDVRWIRI
ncbi:F-box protein [Cardamine amara subsp. amara]|uniref:F-box protein n=1 Tax=Cardamine amara subsp. amara TaxID=228776 RepID=A0ABD1AQ03_CARAN